MTSIRTGLLLALFLLTGLPLQASALSPASLKAIRTSQEAMAAGDYAGAIAKLNAHIAARPGGNNYLVELNLANAHALNAEHKKAIEHYRASIVFRDDYGPAWLNLGRSLSLMEDHAAAAECFLKAAALNADRADNSMFYAAACYLKADQPAKARPLLEKIVSRDAGQTAWLEALLQCYLALELPDEGINTVRQLLRADDDQPRWWKYLAHFSVQQADYAAALNAMMIYSFMTQPSPGDVSLMGDLAAVSAIPRQAAEYYADCLAIQRSPDSSMRISKRRIQALLAAHDSEGALAAIDQAQKVQSDAGLYFLQGQILFRSKQFDQALAAFDDCLRVDAEYGSAHILAAYCLIERGSYAEARLRLLAASKSSKYRKTCLDLIGQIDRILEDVD